MKKVQLKKVQLKERHILPGNLRDIRSGLVLDLDMSTERQYEANIVTNGDMELDSNWTNYGFEGSETNEQSSEKALTGSYSRHIIADAAGEGAVSDGFTVVSGEKYRVEAWVWVVSGAMSLRRNAARLDFTITSSLTGQWEHLSEDIVASSDGAEKVRLECSGGGAEFYVDEVRVRKYEEALLDKSGRGERMVEQTLASWSDTYNVADLTASQGSAEWTDDTTSPPDGSDHSLKVTSEGTREDLRKTYGTPLDLSGKVFKVHFKVSDFDKFVGGDGCEIGFSDTGGTLGYMRLNKLTGLEEHNDEWISIVFGVEDLTASPDMTDINRIYFRVQAAVGESLTGEFSSKIEAFDLDNTAGIVSIMFDDIYETDYTIARAILQDKGYTATHGVIRSYVDAGDRLSSAQIATLIDDGHSMVSHGSDISGLTDSERDEELAAAALFGFQNNYKPHYVGPGGYTDRYMETVILPKYFKSNSTTSNAWQSPTLFDKYRIHRHSIRQDTALADVYTEIDTAIAEGYWLILTFHKLVASGGASSTNDTSRFQAIMDYLDTEGATVRNYDEVCMLTQNKNTGAVNGSTKGQIMGDIRGIIFDGDDWVECAYDSSLDLQEKITITAIINPTTITGDNRIIAKRGNVYYFQVDGSGKLEAYLYGTSSPGWHLTDEVLPLDENTFVAMTYESGTLKLYVNDVVKEFSITGDLASNTNVLSIGSNDAGTERPFIGSKSLFRIYDRVLSANELKMVHRYAKKEAGII